MTNLIQEFIRKKKIEELEEAKRMLLEELDKINYQIKELKNYE